ncbi:hypothetical protein GEMRC1_009716 [Eukaryota sp. GEM-RC1]
MTYNFFDTSTLIDGIVNNSYCVHIYVTVDDEDYYNASSHSDLYSSRRREVAAAPLSLRMLTSASDSDLDDETQEDKVSDRNVALLKSTLSRKEIRTKVPLLKVLDADHILFWIEEMAAYAITKEDTDNSLIRKHLYTLPRTSPLNEVPTICSPIRGHLEVKLTVSAKKNQLLIGCDILKCLGLLTIDGKYRIHVFCVFCICICINTKPLFVFLFGIFSISI